MDDIYMYKEHKSWYWMFQLGIAIAKGTPDEDSEAYEAIVLASEIMHDERKLYSDQTMRDRYGIIW